MQSPKEATQTYADYTSALNETRLVFERTSISSSSRQSALESVATSYLAPTTLPPRLEKADLPAQAAGLAENDRLLR
jgi:hypothetical protein